MSPVRLRINYSPLSVLGRLVITVGTRLITVSVEIFFFKTGRAIVFGAEESSPYGRV